jgi:competence protein ComEC
MPVTAAFQKWLDRYPTSLALFCLCSAICFTAAAPATAEKWLYATWIPPLFLLVSAIRQGSKTCAWMLAGTLFFPLGAHLATRDLSAGKGFDPVMAKRVIQATISSTLATAPGTRILLLDSGMESVTGDLLPGKGRLILRDNDMRLNAGDRIAVKCRLRKPVNRGNPGEFDWEIHCKNEGILWLAFARGQDSLLLLRRGNPFLPAALLFKIRETMSEFLEMHAGRWLDETSRTQVRAIHKALIVGDLGEMTPYLNRIFSDSGLVHALSASGVHVAIVALLAYTAVKVIGYFFPAMFLWLPRRKAGALASIPAMVIYCVLVGARVPAVRSTIMGLIVAVALLTDRRWNSFNSLALAALIILCVYPISLFTPSFQLSFAAVVGILMAANSLIRRWSGPGTDATKVQLAAPHGIQTQAWDWCRPAGRALWAVCFTSFAATVGITPFLLQTFHSFPVYTLLANLLTDFLLTGALGLGLLAAMIGMVFPQLGAVFLAPADLCIRMIIQVAALFAGLPGSVILIPHMGTAEFVLSLGAVLAFLMYLRAPSRRLLFGCLGFVGALAAVAMMSAWFRAPNETLKVVFLNVGKGDAAFVQPAGSRGLLVDGGMKTDQFDSGISIVVPFLRWSGTRSLEGVVISHPEMDHMGGLLTVLAQIPASKVWWNPVSATSPHLEEIFRAAQQGSIPVLSANHSRGSMKLGGASIRFLNGQAPAGRDTAHRDLNNASVAMRVDCGAVSFLFTGDLEREGEEALLASSLPLEATVLKVAHHGGKNSTSSRFLERVKPRIAVISAAFPTTGGLPAQQTLDRLQSGGATVLWTGRDGAITIETDGRTITRVKTGRGGLLGK